MLAVSLVSLLVAVIAIYISSIIEDDVFKAGMRVTALAFTLITLFCAPWILKLGIVAIPLILGDANFWLPGDLS
ncbi:hypothetical protein [Myxosarcina sp. GI1(2024)]